MGYSITDTVVMTVKEVGDEAVILGYEPLIFIGFTIIASIGLIILMKKRR
ncbi:MAG: hypothetical protein ACFFBC_15130 [Promethearchaeota archaeon]